MDDTVRKIYTLHAQGYCCSQIMLKMGLDARGEENPTLLEAAAGLCGGLSSGFCCGTLTGAACLLAMYDKEQARATMIPELVEWFKETNIPRYGGIDCSDIIAGDAMKKFERCPKMIIETFEKCRELLADWGYEI
jgi:hypothetical protein